MLNRRKILAGGAAASAVGIGTAAFTLPAISPAEDGADIMMREIGDVESAGGGVAARDSAIAEMCARLAELKERKRELGDLMDAAWERKVDQTPPPPRDLVVSQMDPDFLNGFSIGAFVGEQDEIEWHVKGHPYRAADGSEGNQYRLMAAALRQRLERPPVIWDEETIDQVFVDECRRLLPIAEAYEATVDAIDGPWAAEDAVRDIAYDEMLDAIYLLEHEILAEGARTVGDLQLQLEVMVEMVERDPDPDDLQYIAAAVCHSAARLST